ncbi:hypothetical protein SAMN05216511_6456 [Streptomyces sp. KS_16]|nr:hypothetical protein BX261_0763 [Streptomyces sp. 2321.6]SDR56933.1 hypothetical protein SAMN05216511_6456 [Streptomyces sp. KS_16]SEB93637.1 hypothetical protein SAMN05428940_0762 [Streptomyces sp. 2133.1]SNC62784.1 hypothetical protein SAMN06272741_0760 [Streptomyces sp. 2114.4]
MALYRVAMSAFMQQLPALIGVVIGALGSYLASTRGDQARFRREQAARWEERRLTAYADFARSLKKSVTLAYRIASHLGNDPHPHPLSPEEAAPHLADATEARDPAGEALLMLGTPDVVEKAREWVVAVMEMEGFLRDQTHSPETWSHMLKRQRAAREGYYAAVRRDLALPPGHSGDWRLAPRQTS